MTRSCCSCYIRRCSGHSGHRMLGSPPQRSLNDDPVLVLCISAFVVWLQSESAVSSAKTPRLAARLYQIEVVDLEYNIVGKHGLRALAATRFEKSGPPATVPGMKASFTSTIIVNGAPRSRHEASTWALQLVQRRVDRTR